MATVLFVLLGFVLGAAIGIALPIGLGLYFALAVEEGAQAGTVFAIILPFTTLAGAVLGVGIGYRRGTTGHWFANASSDYREGFWQQLMEPSPLGTNVFHELTKSTLSDQGDGLKKRREALRAAYQQYQDFEWQPMTIVGIVLLWTLVPLLIPFALIAAILYAAKRAYLRKRIEYAEEMWKTPL